MQSPFVMAAVLVLAASPAFCQQVKVSLVALPAGEGAPAGFQPTEGHPCMLQTTVKNLTDHPVVLNLMRVNATGYLKPDRKPETVLFHQNKVSADGVERSGDKLGLTFRYCFAKPNIKNDKPMLGGLVCGKSSQPFVWLSEDGVIPPGGEHHETMRWLPVTESGDLSLVVTAAASVLDWNPTLQKSIWLMTPGSRILPRPSWTMEQPKRGVDQSENETPFQVWFHRMQNFGPGMSFENAIIELTVEPGFAEVSGANRIVLKPNDPALKSLLPQAGFRPSQAFFSPAMDAWFLCAEKRTWIVTKVRRLELKQDLSQFLAWRLTGGTDASPWKIALDEQAAPLVPHLAGVPRENERGMPVDWALVPVSQIIDRLSDADRAGLQVSANGGVSRK